jgi:hypothetical protein
LIRVLLIVLAAFFWIASILILVFAASGSFLHIIPLVVGPMAAALGIVKLVKAIQEIPSIVHTHILQYSNNPLLRPFFQILTGFFMSVIFFALSYQAAANFHGTVVGRGCMNQTADFLSIFYFSLVTGSTVGYGDLTPEGSARVVAFIQMTLFWALVLAAFTYFQEYASSLRKYSEVYAGPSWANLPRPGS